MSRQRTESEFTFTKKKKKQNIYGLDDMFFFYNTKEQKILDAQL